MRLIRIDSMTIEFMLGSQVPKYAILSHTWEEEEVTFQDFTNPDTSVRSRLKGYGKILKTCELARSQGFEYVWVDTCCIDKTSSAELTEAINSMFQWYRDAEVCYAWLADLRVGDSDEAVPFRSCRWFTRGWTLQELIAPRLVEFYDSAWNFWGTKTDLKEMLIDITGINGEALENPGILYRIPVAQRMSWAARRETTRIEDIAYCLLGIFDINMPMLYGEGSRAFLRLQEHIVKETNDLSIFAWKTPTDQVHHGVFAEHVSAFRDSSSIQIDEDMSFSPGFTVTNKGVQIEADLAASLQSGGYLMKLNCSQVSQKGSQRTISIYLNQHAGGIFSRAKASELGYTDGGNTQSRSELRRMFILKHVSAQRSIDLQKNHQGALFFRKNFNQKGQEPFPDFPFKANIITPSQHWDSRRRMFLTHGASDFTGSVTFELRENLQRVGKDIFGGQWFILVFGLAKGETSPWVTVASLNDGGGELIVARENLKSLAIQGRRRVSTLTTTVDGMQVSKEGFPMDLAPVGKISVTVQQDVVDGQSVHCIDLAYEPIAGKKGKKSKKSTYGHEFDHFLETGSKKASSDSGGFAADMAGWNSE